MVMNMDRNRFSQGPEYDPLPLKPEAEVTIFETVGGKGFIEAASSQECLTWHSGVLSDKILCRHCSSRNFGDSTGVDIVKVWSIDELGISADQSDGSKVGISFEDIPVSREQVGRSDDIIIQKEDPVPCRTSCPEVASPGASHIGVRTDDNQALGPNFFHRRQEWSRVIQ